MKIRNLTILLIIISILSMCFTVKAAENDEYEIGLKADKTTLKAGDTVIISLEISNINIQSGEKGIGAYEGTIKYDTNVFEDLKMKGNEQWDNPTENEGRFSSVRSDGICVNETQEIAQITLKVKEDAISGNTKIQIKDFEGSNGEENIPTEDVELTIKIQNIQNDDNGNTNDDDDNNKNNNIVSNVTNDGSNSGNLNNGSNSANKNSGNSNNGSSTKANVVNKTTSESKLPYTGTSKIVLFFVLIVTILGIFSYVKYKKSY